MPDRKKKSKKKLFFFQSFKMVQFVKLRYSERKKTILKIYLRKFFDRKKIEKQFFFSSIQNGPIRKVNMLKSKFDIFILDPRRQSDRVL